MKPPLPICHLSCTLTLQRDHFDLLLPTFLLNPVSELHLLLVASDLQDHEFGTLYQITSNLLPLSPHSDPESKLTSLLQLVNNWPPSELCASDLTSYSILCAIQMFLHYITLPSCYLLQQSSTVYWLLHISPTPKKCHILQLNTGRWRQRWVCYHPVTCSLSK